MGKITQINRCRDLASRRSVTIELPEFLVRAFEERVHEANASALSPEERVTLEHVVELELAERLSIAEVALLESKVPGIGSAVSQWLADID
jgi:hypothetical protein